MSIFKVQLQQGFATGEMGFRGQSEPLRSATGHDARVSLLSALLPKGTFDSVSGRPTEGRIPTEPVEQIEVVRYGGSRKYRVGVGSRDPSLVVFAVSESEISFGEFARLFRDKLRCKNALFLDGGSATSFYSPVLGRNSNFLPLGPIIGVYGPN